MRAKLASPGSSSGSRFGLQVGATLLRSSPLQLLLLALEVWAVYSRTLDVPFYLDDYLRIHDNPLVYHWQGFAAMYRFEPLRVLSNLSFAFNYHLGHFDPRGYHVTNIIIHFLAGASVYGLTRGLLRTPRLVDIAPAKATAGLPLLAASLFVLHPLQTQAVTYIVQRLASLAALLYLASMAAYVQARVVSGAARWWWGLACLLLGACAVFAKENTATLPLALLLLEIVFFRHGARELLRIGMAAVAGLALVWIVAAIAFHHNPFSLAALNAVTTETTGITRGAYLATQMHVLWIYIRLFFWPSSLHLDYAYTALNGFTSAGTWLALGGHVSVIALALWAWRRQPLIAFSLLFYYLAHGIESSVIPIRDVVFEHRTYLPNLGLCLLVGWVLLAQWPRWLGGTRVALPLAGALLLLLGVTTWRRNELWRDPVTFWQENVRLAPAKPRAWGNLGRALTQAGRPAEGANALQESIRLQLLDQQSGGVDLLDVINLVVALQTLKRYDEALTLIDQGINRPMRPGVRATFYLDRGNILFEQHRFAEAEGSYRHALEINPDNVPSQTNLASIFAETGRLSEAESLYKAVLKVDPDDAATRENYLQVQAFRLVEEGNAQRQANHLRQAQEAYERALQLFEQVSKLNPNNAAARTSIEKIRLGLRGPTVR